MMQIPGQKELTEQEKVNQEWNGMAGEWDDLAGDYAKAFHKLLWEKCGLDKPVGLVVDFGCGTGLLSEILLQDCSRVVALDASPIMIKVLKGKIRDRGFENIHAATVILADLDDNSTNSEESRALVREVAGIADIIVASSVMTFIPKSDLAKTMTELGSMLKPGGIFCHSDWPQSEAHHPDAMTEEKAEEMYQAGGLQTVSMEIVKGGENVPGTDIFFGIARKP